jgi:parvulin-like peptidyl-prolyl isomerase
MNVLYLILVILALICFVFAAVGISTPRGNLVAAGLFLWLLATVVGR